MLARMLFLAALALPPSAGAYPTEPQQHVRQFLAEVRFVHIPPRDSVYTIGLTDGTELAVLAEDCTVVPANGGPHPRALISATVTTELPHELDRVRRWHKLRDFLFGKYRQRAGDARIRAELTCTLSLRDNEEFTELQTTRNPYWDKD